MEFTDEIYQKYARTVYKYLLSLTYNMDIAEELTQETFYQAVRSIHRYDESCSLSTWLCAIAKNQFRSYQRRTPIFENLEDYGQTVPSAETDVFSSERRMELLKKLHQCQEPFREVLYLRIFGELSFKEIGEVMGRKENWARVTFYRGKEKLRREIMENEE